MEPTTSSNDERSPRPPENPATSRNGQPTPIPEPDHDHPDNKTDWVSASAETDPTTQNPSTPDDPGFPFDPELPFLPGITIPLRVGRRRVATHYAAATYDHQTVRTLRNDPAFGRRGAPPGIPPHLLLPGSGIWRPTQVFQQRADASGIPQVRFTTVEQHINALVEASRHPSTLEALERLDAGDQFAAVIIDFAPRLSVDVFTPQQPLSRHYLRRLSLVLAFDPIRTESPILWDSVPSHLVNTSEWNLPG